MLTPIFGGHEGVQTVWVLFSVFLLKFPLVSLLWWFIARNKEWPVRPPKWSERGDARDPGLPRVRGRPRRGAARRAPARLAYLQREAWNVADRVGGELKVDAVNVALHIDELQPPAGPATPHARA